MAFSTLLITQQASMFVGIMQRGNLITETREPNIWVMDPAIEQIDAVRPMRDTELFAYAACPAWRGRPFSKARRS